MKGGGGIEIHSSAPVVVHAETIKLGSDTGLKKLVHEDVLALLNTHVHSGVTSGSATTGPIAPPNAFSALLHATETVEAK
jgi:hypothetical protein